MAANTNQAAACIIIVLKRCPVEPNQTGKPGAGGVMKKAVEIKSIEAAPEILIGGTHLMRQSGISVALP